MQIVLKKLGANNSVFLDVGVNVGQTLLRWKSEYPDSKYIGIEPNIECVYYVNKLISENNFINSTILPIAFSDKQDLNFLYTSLTDPSDSTATTIKDFRENETRKAIPIVSMSYSLLGSKYKFDIIKIDVEGGELEIIQSIFNFGACHAIFICEILPTYNSKNTKRINRQKEIENILNANNYSFFRILKGDRIRLKQIKSIEIHSDLTLSDYLFVPNNKIEEVLSKFN